MLDDKEEDDDEEPTNAEDVELEAARQPKSATAKGGQDLVTPAAASGWTTPKPVELQPGPGTKPKDRAKPKLSTRDSSVSRGTHSAETELTRRFPLRNRKRQNALNIL